MVGTVTLEELRLGDVLGEVPAVARPDVRSPRSGSRAWATSPAAAPHGRRVRGSAASARRGPGARGETLQPPVPVGHARRGRHGWAQQRHMRPLPHVRSTWSWTSSCRRGTPAGYRRRARTGRNRSGARGSIRSGCVAADISAICAAWPCAITERALGARGIHDRDDVVHPILQCGRRGRRRSRSRACRTRGPREARERDQQRLERGCSQSASR